MKLGKIAVFFAVLIVSYGDHLFFFLVTQLYSGWWPKHLWCLTKMIEGFLLSDWYGTWCSSEKKKIYRKVYWCKFPGEIDGFHFCLGVKGVRCVDVNQRVLDTLKLNIIEQNNSKWAGHLVFNRFISFRHFSTSINTSSNEPAFKENNSLKSLHNPAQNFFRGDSILYIFILVPIFLRVFCHLPVAQSQ